jgi:hypothetical protein
MPPAVKLGTCALPFQHQHIAPGDSGRANYSKLRLLCGGRPTSTPKALVRAVATVRETVVGLTSILILISVQLAIIGTVIVN